MFLSLNFQISARLDFVRAGLHFFHAHLLEKPAVVDLLRGNDFEALRQLAVPIITFHPHERAARFVDPKQDVPVLRIAGRRDQLQFPATAGPDGLIAEQAGVLPVEKLERQIGISNSGATNLLV